MYIHNIKYCMISKTICESVPYEIAVLVKGIPLEKQEEEMRETEAFSGTWSRWGTSETWTAVRAILRKYPRGERAKREGRREEGLARLGEKRVKMGNLEIFLKAYMTALDLKRENLYEGRKEEEGRI